MQAIYIIHENDEWTAPLRAELEALGLPYHDWFLDRGLLDLDETPPEGVFYNRMSASSHTRGHRYAAEYAAGVLAWLEAHGRRVINPVAALNLEISKVAQYVTLEAHGIRVPRTVAAIGRQQALDAARRFDGPFITKHNRAGRGLGVRLFHGIEELERYLFGEEFEVPIDGVTLIQEYIESPEPYITRVEFIGGKLLYALRVDTSMGYELCPADVCNDDEVQSRFTINPAFMDPIVDRYARFLSANQIDVAGVEFIVDRQGRRYTYDINTNTNYNSSAEAEVGVSGMRELARYLGDELKRLSMPSPCSRAAEGPC
jgi:hypothetical protein